MADNSTLLEIIHTKYKKQDGILRLLSNEVAWAASRNEKPKICVAFSEIKGTYQIFIEIYLLVLQDF